MQKNKWLQNMKHEVTSRMIQLKNNESNLLEDAKVYW